LKPGTRLVSHDFDMGDWKPDAYVRMDTQDKYAGAGGRSEIYLWIVPARVAGVWRWELPVSGKQVAYEVSLEQIYQVITGSAAVGGRSVALQNKRLRGDAIRFAFTAEVNGAPVKHEFTGKVVGETVTGSARLSGARLRGQHDWHAQRVVEPAARRPGTVLPFARAAHVPLP
jgi:hypothetical protein